ncbi:MAG TPA: hypothetical protein VM364_06265 [Vicinamibacterales bacterium]|nr:hypothetical protein [Vicinamibacterales bacterium]
MNDWRAILRQGDPAAALDPQAAARMRQAVVRAAAADERRAPAWPMRLAFASFAGLVLTLSVLGTRPAHERPGPAGVEAGAERRQIHFTTPGGTRIIWEINPEFRLEETAP